MCSLFIHFDKLANLKIKDLFGTTYLNLSASIITIESETIWESLWKELMTCP